MRKSRLYRLNPLKIEESDETPLVPGDRLDAPPEREEDERDAQRLVFDNRQRRDVSR